MGLPKHITIITYYTQHSRTENLTTLLKSLKCNDVQENHHTIIQHCISYKYFSVEISTSQNIETFNIIYDLKSKHEYLAEMKWILFQRKGEVIYERKSPSKHIFLGTHMYKMYQNITYNIYGWHSSCWAKELLLNQSKSPDFKTLEWSLRLVSRELQGWERNWNYTVL
jgi:hypothetical protein